MEDASSILMLKTDSGYGTRPGIQIAWIDSVVITERPSSSPYIDAMKEAISGAGIPLM